MGFGRGLGCATRAHEGAPSAFSGRCCLVFSGVTVQVRSRNSGRHVGREIVRVHLSRTGEVEGPTNWCAGPAAVDAVPGEEAWSRPGPSSVVPDWRDDEWCTEIGVFTIHIGWSCRLSRSWRSRCERVVALDRTGPAPHLTRRSVGLSKTLQQVITRMVDRPDWRRKFFIFAVQRGVGESVGGDRLPWRGCARRASFRRPFEQCR